MALVVKDRVRETSTTTGTGTFTLNGAVTGFQSFLAIGDGNTTYYTIVDGATGDWEVGIGTYSSGVNTLSRTTVLESSNSGNLVAFAAGAKDVFCTYPAEKSVDSETAQTLTNKTLGSGTAISGGTINGATIGGTTAAAGSFTTLTTSSTVTHNGGTANGVAYLNGSNALTTGTALTYNGTGLGVGVASPARLIDAYSAANGIIQLRGGSSTNQGSAYFIRKADDSGTLVAFGDRSRIFGGTPDQIASIFTSSVGSIPLTFDINGSEQMRLTSTGLGIGTSSPSYKLQVTQDGNLNATSAITNATAGTSSVARFLAISDAGNAVFGMTSSSYTDITGTADSLLIGAGNASGGMSFALDGFLKMKLDSSGNLGLGVTPSAWASGSKAIQVNPFVSLSCQTDGAANFGFNFYEGGPNTFNYVTTDEACRFSALTTGGFGWYTAPSGTAGNAISFTQAMRLDASGNLGIGTSSPSKKLVVSNAGAIGLEMDPSGRSGESATSLLSYNRSTSAFVPAQYDASEHQFMTSTSERMRLDSSGNLGLGVTPSAWSTGKAFEVGALGDALFGVSLNEIYLTQNAYFNSGWKYGATATAARYGMNSGAHQWFTAPSGTAGNAISFTQAMTLLANGNLLVGRTADSIDGFARINVSGTTDTAIQITKSGVIATRLTAVSSGLAFGVDGSDGATERMRLDSSGNLSVTGAISGGYTALAAGTTAMGFAGDNVVRVTPNATATYTTTVPTAGAICVLSILTSGTTSYTITFGTGFKATGTLATGTVSARYFQITFVSDGTNLLEMSRTTAIA